MAQAILFNIQQANNESTHQILQASGFDVFHMQTINDTPPVDDPLIIVPVCQKSDATIIPIIDRLHGQFPDASLVLIAEQYDLMGAEYCLRLPNKHYLLKQQLDLLPALLEAHQDTKQANTTSPAANQRTTTSPPQISQQSG